MDIRIKSVEERVNTIIKITFKNLWTSYQNTQVWSLNKIVLDKKNETCIEDKREQRQQKESMSYRGQSKMESHGRKREDQSEKQERTKSKKKTRQNQNKNLQK